MGSRKKKGRKYILVIVEGKTDAIALGAIFTRLFDKNEIQFEIIHEDITSKNGVTTQNIKSKIGNVVREFMNTYFLKASDFEKVVFITDTDGTYCDDDCVIEDPTCTQVMYSTTEIRCKCREDIIKRNKKKSSILNLISGMTCVVRTIPFEAYYMSSNLDHVLYDVLNTDAAQKESNAF